MKEEKNIEQLFKDAFSNFEAPVDPALWQNIENSISSSVVNPADQAISTAANKVLVVKTLSMIAGVALITAGVLHYFNRPEKTETKPSVHATEEVITPAVQPKEIQKTTDAETLQPAEKNKPVHSAVKKIIPENKTNTVTPVVKTEAPQVVNTTNNHQENATVKLPDNNNAVKSESVKKTVAPATPAVTENKVTETPKQNTASKPETVDVPGLGNTIFTPNGDGIGDVFKFDDSYLTEVNVKIYNSKNYKLVYEWNQTGGSWDGRLRNGNEADEGIYIVMINGKGVDGNTYKSTIKLQLRRN